MPAEDDFAGDFANLATRRVLIWGLGLMGGSLAMGLGGHCAELLGVDSDPAVIEWALAHGVVQRASTQPADLLAQADVIVLAAPVRAILRMLTLLPDLHPAPALVLDVGSTKRAVIAAMDSLPDRFDPLGMHPMCGKERGSLHNAEADLFCGAPFALVAAKNTSPVARAVGEGLAHTLGGCPFWVDAHSHDKATAHTSHVPYLLAAALTAATPSAARVLIGPGFRSSSRLAGSSARMMTDILATNPDEVLSALQDVHSQLETLESLILTQNWEALEAHLERIRQQWNDLGSV